MSLRACVFSKTSSSIDFSQSNGRVGLVVKFSILVRLSRKLKVQINPVVERLPEFQGFATFAPESYKLATPPPLLLTLNFPFPAIVEFPRLIAQLSKKHDENFFFLPLVNISYSNKHFILQ